MEDSLSPGLGVGLGRTVTHSGTREGETRAWMESLRGCVRGRLLQGSAEDKKSQVHAMHLDPVFSPGLGVAPQPARDATGLCLPHSASWGGLGSTQGRKRFRVN